DEEVYDGMDIALCSLRMRNENEEKDTHSVSHSVLKYAGAHNPLWIVRKGECIDIQADKMPIGKFGCEKSFTTHQFDLEKDDLVYIFSDGYADQFGGDKGKKFKPTAFKDLLLSIYHLPLAEQQA